jgi:hypothetical protein
MSTAALETFSKLAEYGSLGSKKTKEKSLDKLVNDVASTMASSDDRLRLSLLKNSTRPYWEVRVRKGSGKESVILSFWADASSTVIRLTQPKGTTHKAKLVPVEYHPSTDTWLEPLGYNGQREEKDVFDYIAKKMFQFAAGDE